MSAHWAERCLFCGEIFHDLVAAQEHVMDVHGYTQDDIRKNTKRSDGEGYIFTMPDGKDWMAASKEALEFQRLRQALNSGDPGEAREAVYKARETGLSDETIEAELRRGAVAEINAILENNRTRLDLIKSGLELFDSPARAGSQLLMKKSANYKPPPGSALEATNDRDLSAMLQNLRSWREKSVLGHVAATGGIDPQIKAVDAQMDEILSLMSVPAPAESAGAGKMRVLEDRRLPRDPHTQVRGFPLRDRVQKALFDGDAEAARNMNEDARELARQLTGKPVIKAVEEIMNESFPGLVQAFYPRIYENVGRYNSPRDCAVMMANAVAETLRYGAYRASTAYRLLMPGLAFLKERRMPMFFIAPDLLEAVLRTDFDDDIDWTELQLPYESGVFILPKGALVHPESGEVSMLIWSRLHQGLHPSPWPGVPQPDLPYHAFVILGACVEKMIWFDSIFTANVRKVVRLRNLFYREPGQPIPATAKSNVFDSDLTEEDSGFVEKMGAVVFGTILAMNARPQLVEPGKLLKRVGGGDKPAREFWSPNVIGAKYKIKREVAKIVDRKFVVPQRESGGTHASPRMHWRRGHYRNQPVGPGRKERKQIWIEPCLIGAGEGE